MKTTNLLIVAALLLCAVPTYTQFCEFRYVNSSVCTDVYNCPATGGLGYVRKTYMFPTVQCPINGTFCYVAHTDETYLKCVSIQKCNLCLDPNSASSCEGCVPLTEDVQTTACDANQCYGLNYSAQGTQLPTNDSMNSFCEFRYVNESVCTDAFNCSATGGLGLVRKTFIFPTVQCPINETFCYIAHTDPTGLKCVNIEKCDSCSNSSEAGSCVGCMPLSPADYGLYRGCDATTCWGLNYSANAVGTGSGSGNNTDNSTGSGSNSSSGSGSGSGPTGSISGSSTSSGGYGAGAGTAEGSYGGASGSAAGAGTGSVTSNGASGAGDGTITASVGGHTATVSGAAATSVTVSSGITISSGMVVSVIVTLTACLIH